MAGDWIKVEENMPDKPEVWEIADILKIDGDSVAGKLLRIWAWATRNCNADGVTFVTAIPAIDRLAGVSGFANAMIRVGWLNSTDSVLTFPKFERHCSQTAKERSNTNRRVANYRKKCNDGNVTDVTGEALQKPLPEKRREDTNTPLPPEGGNPPKVKGPLQLRAERIFRRREDTPLTVSEERAFKKNKEAIKSTNEPDWLALEAYYSATIHRDDDIRRRDLAQLLNNWNGEIDRAKSYATKSKPTSFQPSLKIE